MRLERQRGFVGRMRDVERRHQELYDQFKPFWQIAVEMYDRHPAQSAVRQLIEDRYGVRIAEKTAGAWINRGLEERRRELEKPAEATAQT